MACEQQRAQRNRVYLATMSPSTSGVATALAEVLAAMGEPDAKGSPAILARRIRAKVKEHGALIILDEAQHLSVQAIEELRAIQDATGCGMALVGDERLAAVFDGTAYAQLRRRIARRCPPVRTLDEDVRAVAAAWKVTAKDEVDFLRRVAKQPGALGGVANVIEMGTQLAALEEKPRDLGHMMSAWADLMPGQAL
jgi:DNA transposition AAA+ family ATPase